MLTPTDFNKISVEEFIEHMTKAEYYHVVIDGVANLECNKSGFTGKDVKEIVYRFNQADLAIVGRSHFSGICFYQYALRLDRGSNEAYLFELLIADDPKTDYLFKRVFDIWYPVKYWLKEAEAVVLPLIFNDFQNTEEFIVEVDKLNKTTKLIRK